jgi:hypothetical protein
MVHCRCLSTADSTNFLGSANGSDTHTDTKSVGTSLDEMKSLDGSDNVAANDINFGMGCLEMLDYLQLVGGIALGGIYDEDINPGIN